MGIYIQRGDSEDIGTHGLKGTVNAKLRLITIKGPCGEGHTMSFEAAAELQRWLGNKLAAQAIRDENARADALNSVAAGEAEINEARALLRLPPVETPA